MNNDTEPMAVLRGADGRLYRVSQDGCHLLQRGGLASVGSAVEGVESAASGIFQDYASARPMVDPGDHASARPMVDPGDHASARPMVNP